MAGPWYENGDLGLDHSFDGDSLRSIGIRCGQATDIDSIDTVSLFDDEIGLCPVCLNNETRLPDRRPCCDQSICQTCLERHVRSKLEDGAFRVVCPNPGCDSLVQVYELSSLRPELARQFYRRLVDVNADPHRKTCPNCCFVTEVEPPRSEALEDGMVISCSECQFQWCFQCHGPQHRGITCDKNRHNDHKLQRWAQRERTAHQEDYVPPRAQQCPVCKIYIERISGCEHMECRMCRAEFCYHCGQLWDDYSHSDAMCIRGREIAQSRSQSPSRPRLRKKLKNGAIIGGAVVGVVIAAPIVVGLAVPVAAVAASTYAVWRIKRAVCRHSSSRPKRVKVTLFWIPCINYR